MNNNTKRKEGKRITDLARGEHEVDTMRIPGETRWLTNVAFMLGDVMTGMLMEAEWRVGKLGFSYKHTIKQRWRRLNDTLAAARRASKDFCREMYELDDADKATEDSDYLSDLLMLICDRIGDSQERQAELRRMIEGMPSYCHFYDKLQGK